VIHSTNWVPAYPLLENEERVQVEEEEEEHPFGQGQVGDELTMLRRQMTTGNRHGFDAQTAQVERNLIQLAQR